MTDKVRMEIATAVALYMQGLNIDFSSKGGKALFCIACAASEKNNDAEPWGAARMAHDYAAFIGSTQTAVWQNMWRALQKAAWSGTVSEAIYRLAGWGGSA